MPGLAHELGQVVIAERLQRRRVRVVEAARSVDDPDRLGDLVEDRLALAQRLLGDAPALLDVGEREHRAGAVPVSIGVAVYETGNIDPSRRTNQSSPL